jgi:DNA primase
MQGNDLDSVKTRILSRISLPELIGSTVKLTRRSGNYVGCCPFHNEKGPSFTVYPDHYFCYGCRAHGDAIDFIRKTQGLGFIESLRYLGEKAGVEVPELERSRTDENRLKERASLLGLMQHAQNFYVDRLNEDAGDSAKRYLADRGFSPENIKEFGFGLSPDSFEALTGHLRKVGFSTEQMLDTSVASISNRTNQPFDFFRNRLMIPIRDPSGRVIAFGGRTLGNDPAKYVNSRESKLYDKSAVLFGLDRAKDSIKRSGRAIVTEGYMDCMQLWQHGIGEAVACLGTALTVPQLRLLAPHCSRICLLFDGDAAGQAASLRSVSIALEVPEIEVRVAQLPADQDPDSFVRARGPEAIKALVTNAEPLLDFAIRNRLKQTHALGIPELVSSEFIPWLAKTSDTIQRSFLTQRLASLTGISSQQLNAEIRKLLGGEISRAVRPMNQNISQAPASEQVRFKLDAVTEELIGHIFFSKPSEELICVIGELTGSMEWPSALMSFLEDMLTTLQSGNCPAEQSYRVWPSFQHPSIVNMLETLIKKRDAFLNLDAVRAIRKIQRQMTIKSKEELRTKLKAQIGRASREEQRELLGAIQNVNKEIESLRLDPAT